jgi:hypothetical protein
MQKWTTLWGKLMKYCGKPTLYLFFEKKMKHPR